MLNEHGIALAKSGQWLRVFFCTHDLSVLQLSSEEQVPPR
jgi:hypothetical protein